MRVSFALTSVCSCVALAVALAVFSIVASIAACTLPAGEPCCSDDSEGARCFESRCATLCDEDSQCDEGETCVDAGVCGATVRGVADACVFAVDEEDA